MPKARTVADVILGEAVHGSRAKRYADMKAIASVIQNRARSLGVTPEQVVSNRREFNAYGKSLPAGVNSYRSMAEEALRDVAENGPSHNATFYATPSASGNLPRGLKQETQTGGHIYYSDPQNRAIGTSLGYRQPQQQSATQAIAGLMGHEQPTTVNDRMGLVSAYAPEERAVSQTVPTHSVKTTSYFRPEPQASLDTLKTPSAGLLADQYASYGEGKIQRNPNAKMDRLPIDPSVAAGLLSQDVANQGLIDQLNAQKAQLATGVNPMEGVDAWAPRAGVGVQTQQPQDVPMVEAQPQINPVQSQYSGGLLSPDEQSMYEAQRANLASQPYNGKFGMKAGNFAKGALGGIGGGLLGAALLGPVGGLLGAALGKSITNGRINSAVTGFPQAPNSRSQGDGKETAYGRTVRESSGQYRNAINNGGIGLY